MALGGRDSSGKNGLYTGDLIQKAAESPRLGQILPSERGLPGATLISAKLAKQLSDIMQRVGVGNHGASVVVHALVVVLNGAALFLSTS